MAQVVMIYDAKCKHCIHMEYKSLTKKNGDMSKVSRGFCNNPNSPMFQSDLTLKSKACDKIEL